mgnify:FL=1
MSILDEIYKKRLERIRDDLDAFLDEVSKKEISENQTAHGIAPKFLSYLKLCDDEDTSELDDFHYVEEEKETPKESVNTPSFGIPAPMQRMDSQKSGTIPIPEFLQKNHKYEGIDKALEQKAESFSEMLLRLIDEKGLKDSAVYKRANIDRRLFSKIRGDENYVPSKKTAIAFCLALQLELDQAEKLLETAGYSLSQSSRFDLIIRYLIENEEYNIQFVNIVLDDYGEGTLSK